MLFYYLQKLVQMKVSKLILQGQMQVVGELKVRKIDIIVIVDSISVNSVEMFGECEKVQEIEQFKCEVVSLKVKLVVLFLQFDNGSLCSVVVFFSFNVIQVKIEFNDKEVVFGLCIDVNEKVVILNFDVDFIQLNDEGSKVLDKSIGDWVCCVKFSQGKIVVIGVIGSGVYSESW